MVEDEQHGNVEYSPARDAKEQRPLSSAKTLKGIDRKEAHEHERRRKGSNSQEICAQTHGLRIRNEELHDAACQQFIHGDTQYTDDQACHERKANDRKHALAVAR